MSDGGRPSDIERENRMLERRLRRMEANVRRLEEFQDSNATLMSRILEDLEAERARSRALLLNVLPQRIIDRLNVGENRIADRHEDVTVLFSDIVGFTTISADLQPSTLVDELSALFTGFDAICDEMGVEKIKTVGDAYLVVGGLSRGAGDRDAAADTVATARTGLRMVALATDRAATGQGWQIRIGIHAGPLVAGVVGATKFAYDVWGDTVNVASRLESTSEPGRIQVSGIVADRLREGFVLEARGAVELKGRGAAETAFVVGPREDGPPS